jgi:hypothetical protein
LGRCRFDTAAVLGERRGWFALPLAKTLRIALSTAFYSHPSFWQHAMGAGHPECPERLDAIEEALRRKGLIDHLLRREARPANADKLALAHHAAYLAQTMARLSAVRDVVRLDPDTAANPLNLTMVAHIGGVGGARTHPRALDAGAGQVQPRGVRDPVQRLRPATRPAGVRRHDKLTP